jgi:2',3'-cyclic-nucleotide 2'-phosphodiesterase (5'-nucleotidase family)
MMPFKIKILFFSAVISLYACQHKALVTNVSETHIIVNQNKIDSAIYNTIAPYKKTQDEKMKTVIAQSEDALLKADVESSLGNFFCDAVLYETKKLLGVDSAMVDIAVFNKGGLRNALPKGNITVGNIFELMPFDNELVILKLSGSQIKDMLTKIAEKGGIPVGGMTLLITKTTASNITIKGKPFDETKDYWVVTSDYLANGGDNYTFFKNAKERKVMNILLRDVIINYCKDITQQGKILKPTLDGRIQLSK